MKLSIIIPTLNRITELKHLLQSILDCDLEYSNEIIIIDQNPIGFLDGMLEEFNSVLNINHQLVTFKGLSKAKNFGAKLAKGEYFSFPDDDCKILSETYSIAFKTIKTENVDVVFGRCIDVNGNDSVLKFKKESYFLNTKNMLGGFVEATGVINKSIFEKGFCFDENMGAGCFHGAEEGYDWLYRILKNSNIKAFYNPEVKFYHPQVLLDKGTKQALKRVFTYSCGKAYLYKKHHFYFRYIKRLLLIIISAPIYVIINRKKARYYFVEMLGLLTGFCIPS
jgi:glycosyltransferase involved in cell wall biosynthesis